eukprot:1028508-Amphidinium_carterae.3
MCLASVMVAGGTWGRCWSNAKMSTLYRGGCGCMRSHVEIHEVVDRWVVVVVASTMAAGP